MGRKIYRRDSNPGSIRGWPIIPMLHIYMVCLARLCKTHTYPVWGMTTLRQFRSSGPMRAPCSRGLSLGLLVPNVYWVLFFFTDTARVFAPARPSACAASLPFIGSDLDKRDENRMLTRPNRRMCPGHKDVPRARRAPCNRRGSPFHRRLHIDSFSPDYLSQPIAMVDQGHHDADMPTAMAFYTWAATSRS